MLNFLVEGLIQCVTEEIIQTLVIHGHQTRRWTENT